MPRWQVRLAQWLAPPVEEPATGDDLVTRLATLVRDEHFTYHEGGIDECMAPLCREFYRIVGEVYGRHA